MNAAIFPGQGSQKPGMGRDLASHEPAAAAVFDAVSDALGTDMRQLCWELDEETLRQTENAQLALYTCGVAAFQVLAGAGIEIEIFAGHSVGEYAALAASGTITIEDGARLVQKRGQVMASAGVIRPGTMAAVLGLDRSSLEEVCRSVAGEVVVANDNCPGQLVISGEIEAVRLACEAASASGAKRVLPLNVSGAFHSPLMAEPAKAMREILAATTFKQAKPVVSNVTAQPISDASQWPDLLERQLCSPVRWTESVQAMLAIAPYAFVECGVGEVLSGLIRRIDKTAPCYRVMDAASLAETVSELA